MEFFRTSAVTGKYENKLNIIEPESLSNRILIHFFAVLPAHYLYSGRDRGRVSSQRILMEK